MKIIKLTKGYETIVDDEDFEELSKYKWTPLIGNSTYSARGERKLGVYSKILMHRIILNAIKGDIVDHINGNGLDNRKINLRLTTRSGNLRNSKLRSDSKCSYKGVSKRHNHYIARIQIAKDNRIYLGQFKTEIEAAEVYNKAAIKYFGEFARLNVLK